MSVTVNDAKRKNFQSEENDSVGNNLEITSYDKDAINIRIDNPWAGDTESGFGQTCAISLCRDDAIEMAKFILKIYKQP